jgi:hypothetical protein
MGKIMAGNSPIFNFEFEFETFEKAGAGKGKERRIGGIVSTDHMDKQQERLVQKGLDFSPFLDNGYFNDNHSKATGGAVGYPEIAELRHLPDGRQGWYVEGYLLKGHPPADEIWTMATALERSGAPRRLGFSVEGQILERDPMDPSLVKKAVVREVAVTRCPVNDNTQLSVLAKSLSVGHGGSGSGSGVPGAAGPLSQESLEGRPSPRPDPEEDEDEKKRKKKKMKKSEAIRFLMTRHSQLSETSATRIVEYALRREAA